MKKQTITQGTIILIAAGFITKILGMLNRIIVTRQLGQEGIGIYMLIQPTIILLATFASIGLPVAIPALISRSDSRQKKILSVSLIIAMLSSFIVSVILFFAARPLANILLKDERTYLPLLSIGPLLFCISLSTILKAYFQGEQNMIPSAVSTLIEQVVRTVATIGFVSVMMPHGIIYGVVGVIWASIVGELASSFILLIMFFKNMKQNHLGATLKPTRLSSQNFKDVLNISFPTTGSRLIGSFTHFLEPIIIIQALYRIGYSSQISSKLYSAVAGFALPVLLMPSFISQAVTQSIIPPISQAYTKRNFSLIHRHLNTAFQLSFVISGLYTILVMIFPNEIMNLLYNTSTGSEYVLYMAPFFLLLYFQSSLTATLQAIDEAKVAMKSSLIASIIKILLMIALLQVPRLNILGLVITIIFNIVLLTLWHYFLVKKKVGYRANYRSIINGFLVIGVSYLLGKYLKSTVIISEHQTLNILGLIGLISLGYLALITLCGLFPQQLLSERKKRQKIDKPIIA